MHLLSDLQSNLHFIIKVPILRRVPSGRLSATEWWHSPVREREREQAVGGCNFDITQNTICIIGSGCSSKLIMANWRCILPPYNTANCVFLTSSKLFRWRYWTLCKGVHIIGNYISLGTQEKSSPSNEVINDTNIKVSWRELKFIVWKRIV